MEAAGISASTYHLRGAALLSPPTPLAALVPSNSSSLGRASPSSYDVPAGLELEQALLLLFLEALGGFCCLVACALATPLLVLRMYVVLQAPSRDAALAGSRVRSE
mmetsp:Transcript_17910/g.46958  ORF Transcript_17910/g.46958 Transcript_17910/m.46958 type:complete len:106 (-) Transcript_17910:69-386(-)